MKLILALLLSICASSASIYYVDTANGGASDSNPGTAGSPWKTIQHAATTAVAGDTVNIVAGEYNEFITPANSGSAGSPIIFQGQRGGSGEWLSIVNPSTPVTNGWVAAPDIGAGVYTHTSMPNALHELEIGGKRVAFVHTMAAMTADIDSAYISSGWTTGAQLLALASGQTANVVGGTVLFWDGIEALWSATNTTTAFLRLRDGSDPNGLDIRVAPNGGTLDNSDISNPAISIANKSYLTFQNLLIQGAICGMLLNGSSVHHINIVSNYFTGGRDRVWIGGGAYQNSVLSNTIDGIYYGATDIGSWSGGTSSNYLKRQVIYNTSKFLMGAGGSHDDAVKFVNPGNSNVVAFNTITHGMGTGVNLAGDITAPAFSTLIFSNTISSMPSVGIHIAAGHTDTRIFDNQVSDCNSNLRWHAMDTTGETNRIVYVYRNRLWQPASVGDQIYIHFNNDTADSYFPEYWYYNNSYSGGRYGLSVSSYVINSGGLQGCRFLNSIFSGAQYASDGATGKGFMTNATMVALFDYNLIAPVIVSYPVDNPAAWWGAHVLTNSVAQWSSLDTTLALAAGSQAINSGQDLTVAYPALPQDGTVKIGTAWDMGALEAGATARVKTGHAGQIKGK